MAYTLSIKRSALKSLKSLPKAEQTKVRQTIDSLQNNPRPSTCKKLKGSSTLGHILVNPGSHIQPCIPAANRYQHAPVSPVPDHNCFQL